MIRRISVALAVAALAIGTLAPHAFAQSSTVTLPFAFNAAGTGTILHLHGGQNACSVTVASAGTGLNALVLKNSADGAQTFSANSNIGSITTTGAYSGALVAGATDVVPVVTALTSGPVTGTIVCYVAASSGGGGGGGTYTAPPVQPVSPATGASPFTVQGQVQISGPLPQATCPGAPNAPCVQISGVVTAHNDGSFPTAPPVQPVSGTVSAAISNFPSPCPTDASGYCFTHPTFQPTYPPTAAPQSSASPGYARLEDGTTTNLACIQADNALCIGTASTLVQLNPTVTASSAYAAGNCVGGLLSFGSVFRNATNTGILESIAISVKSTQSVSFKLYVFDANPTSSTFTDKAAPAIASADIGKAIGVYTLAAYDNGLGTSTVYQLDGISKQIGASSSTLYGVLVTTAAVTFASSSDVYVSVGVLQD